MKKNNYSLSVLFTVVLTLVLLCCAVARLVYPMVILPQWNIPNLVALSAVALVVNHYFGGRGRQCCGQLFLFAFLSSTLLPWAAGWCTPVQMLGYGISGGLVFTVTAWLFESLQERLSSGPAAKAAPLLGAAGLYLAAQALQGILL